MYKTEKSVAKSLSAAFCTDNDEVKNNTNETAVFSSEYTTKVSDGTSNTQAPIPAFITPSLDQPNESARIKILSEQVFSSIDGPSLPPPPSDDNINATDSGVVDATFTSPTKQGCTPVITNMDTEQEASTSTAPAKRKKISDSPENVFRQFKRPVKLNTVFRSRRLDTTKTSNKFTPLSESEDDGVESSTSQQIEQAARKVTPTKATVATTAARKRTQRIPPIVIEGHPPTHKDLLADIGNIIKGGYEVKYAYNSTIIFPKVLQDHHKLKTALLETKRHKFHTYTSPDEMRHAFVLRGLDASIDLAEIKAELVDLYSIDVIDVVPMKTKFRPLYLVVTGDAVTLKQLQTNVPALQCIKVTWERRRNERGINQCRRCQIWGHSASNCARDPRCVKCAGLHYTRECTKTPNQPPKCCNCGGEHTACDVNCPVYIKRSEVLSRRQTVQQQQQQKPAFKPAPPPKVNAWTARQQAMTTNSISPPTTKLSKASVAQAQQSSQSSGPSTSITASSATTGSAGMGDMQRLFTEIRCVNEKINIKQALLAFKEFNSMLGDGPLSQLEKFSILEEFVTETLPKYNL